MWAHRLFACDCAGALPLAEEGFELARRRGATPDRRSLALASLGMSRLFMGGVEPARALVDQALAAAPDPYEPGAGLCSGGSIAQPYLALIMAMGARWTRRRRGRRRRCGGRAGPGTSPRS